jgi:Ca2+/H+ antiporter, TMEM165/GDT1 family
MDLGIIAAVYVVIFVGELPDKTMFASLVLSTHGRPRMVWLGAAGAFVVHVIIATTIGVALFALLPPRVVDGLVAVLFLVGAVYAYREAIKEREEEAIIGRVGQSRRSVLATAFVVIFLAEWGDLTQILTANMAVRFHEPISVAVGAVLALWSVAALAVVGGRGLLRFVDIGTVRRITAAVLLILAAVAGWSAIAQSG